MQNDNTPGYQPHQGPGFTNPSNHIPQETLPASQHEPAPVMRQETVASQPSSLRQPDNGQSVPVVRVLSVRGVEYALMTSMVWFGAASLVTMLLAIVNGEAGFDVLAFPLALLLTSLPVFALLFIRLRKAELADPSLRQETSKRRYSQITQFVAFFACFFNIVAFIYQLISMAGETDGDIDKAFLNMLVILVVAGGVFAYYWFDEHRSLKG